MRRVVCAALLLSLLSIEVAAQSAPRIPTLPQLGILPPPLVERDDKLTDIVQRNEAYYTQVGKTRGTGFRQYKRWQEFASPRAYPAGDLVNFTALAWVNHYRKVRAPEFAAQREAALAAGIGTGDWRLIGPTGTPQGERAGDIGRVNVIIFHPSQPQTIYIGTPAGGVWKTQDDGANWTSLSNLPMLGITDIAIDPAAPDTIYVMTGDGEGGDLSHGPPSVGVLKSTDGGNTWNNTGLTWTTNQLEYGHRLVIHPTMPQVLLAATTVGLLRTDDGGATWKLVAEGVPEGARSTRQGNFRNQLWDVQFHPADPSIVYAASTTNVYRSDDAGQTWTMLAGGLPNVLDRTDPNTSNRIRLAVSPAKADTLYVLYGSRSGFVIGLYRSDDRGNTFARRSSTNPRSRDPSAPLPIDLTKPNLFGYEPNDFKSQTDYGLAMTVSPTNIDRVHVGGVDTWRSDDGGSTWTKTSRWWADAANDYVHADIHALIYRGDTLFVGTDGGVYRSSDAGDNWTSITTMTNNFAIAQVYTVCATPQDPNLFYYGAQDNGTFRLELDGQVRRVYGGDGMACQINPKNSGIVYASYVYGEIYRSDDGGQNFNRRITPKVQGHAVQGPWLTPYKLGPADPDSIYACYTDLWLSPDRGFSWKNLTNGALGSSMQCQQVAVAESDPETIYVAKQAEWDVAHFPGHGDTRTPFLGGGGVFRSTDGGATWQMVSAGLPLGQASITNLAISPTDPRRVWVTFSGYNAEAKIFRTSDGGERWVNLSDGLPNLPVNAVAAKQGDSNGVYVGLDVGVYYRDDRLDTWVPFMDGLPDVIVSSLLIDETRQRMIAGTFGRGVWLTELRAPCTDNCNPPAGRGATPARRSAISEPPRSARQTRSTYVGPIEVFEPK